jgi:hypothetical protein
MTNAHGTGAGTGPDHSASEHVPLAHGDGHTDQPVDAAGHADAEHHDADGHGGGHGDGLGLGPIDWGSWLLGAFGVAVGLVIVAAFVLALGDLAI